MRRSKPEQTIRGDRLSLLWCVLEWVWGVCLATLVLASLLSLTGCVVNVTTVHADGATLALHSDLSNPTVSMEVPYIDQAGAE